MRVSILATGSNGTADEPALRVGCVRCGRLAAVYLPPDICSLLSEVNRISEHAGEFVSVEVERGGD